MKCSYPYRVRQPPRPEPNSPIIIFLRRGTPTATQNEKCTRSLAFGANAVAVEIDYSLSKQDPYPAPIHTVGVPDISQDDMGSDGMCRYLRDMIGFKEILPIGIPTMKLRRLAYAVSWLGAA